MALTNLGFETAGGSPGTPAAWTVFVTAAAEHVATFGTGSPELDEEGFEAEWNNDSYLFAFGLGDTAPPLLDTDVAEGEAIEDFEEGWDGNHGYSFELGSTDTAAFDAPLATEDHEDFSDAWDSGATAGNDYDFVMGALVSAFFDASFAPQGFEDFEDGWAGTGVGNDYDLVLGASTAASFDGALAPEAFEDFEEVRTEIQVTADPATDTLTAASNHLFNIGDRVSFRVSDASPGALPAGLNSVFSYHVLAAGLTLTAFRVSVAAAGAAVDLTDAGVGTFYLVYDRSRYWVIELP